MRRLAWTTKWVIKNADDMFSYLASRGEKFLRLSDDDIENKADRIRDLDIGYFEFCRVGNIMFVVSNPEVRDVLYENEYLSYCYEIGMKSEVPVNHNEGTIKICEFQNKYNIRNKYGYCITAWDYNTREPICGDLTFRNAYDLCMYIFEGKSPEKVGIKLSELPKPVKWVYKDALSIINSIESMDKKFKRISDEDILNKGIALLSFNLSYFEFCRVESIMFIAYRREMNLIWNSKTYPFCSYCSEIGIKEDKVSLAHNKNTLKVSELRGKFNICDGYDMCITALDTRTRKPICGDTMFNDASAFIESVFKIKANDK